MASRANRLGPKVIWSLVLIKHGPCHFNQSPVLPLNNAILLRCVWCGELMLDSFFIKKLFNIGVLELRPIVTSYMLDLQLKLILSSLNESLDDCLSFTLVLQKENPCEARKVIYNDKSILVPANANISNRSK